MSNDAAIRAHLEQAQSEIDAALGLLEDDVPPDTETIPVKPGDDLLAKIAAAPEGATLSIDPAFTSQMGYWSLAKPLTLQSSATLPDKRVDKTLKAPKLHGFLNVTGAKVTLRGLWLEGLHPSATLVTTGPQTTLDRCVLLGSPNGQHRGVAANSAGVKVLKSHISNIWKDQDTQAVAGWNGTKDLVVDDCYLEASGENIMFGGADCPSEDKIPQDVLITNSHLFKPMEWRGKAGCVVKNLYELKNAKRVTLRGCTLENSWTNGQVGFAIVLSVRNQGGKNPWATIENCVIEDCITKNSAGGVSVLGRDDSQNSKVMTNMMLRRNKFTNINPEFGANGRQVQILGGPINLSFEDNEWQAVRANTLITFDHPNLKVQGFRFVRNKGHEGAYGIHGTDAPGLGKVVLDFYCPDGYAWDQVTIVNDGSRNITYPPGTTMVNP